MKKEYYGNYLGIVVQNNDPDHRGRIKVFVPHVSATLYEDFNKTKKDKSFKFPGDGSDLDNIIDRLKDVLPWAECAAPIFGGSASGRYNATTKKGTTADTNYWEGDELVDGERPLQNYLESNIIPDAFSTTGLNRNRFVNPYTHQYTPSKYSNLARGMFSIPNVGSHVWIFFANGDVSSPVYFAVSYGEEDFKRIYSMETATTDSFSSTDYPASYENIKKDKLDDDSKTFRAKSVLNSNKHAIEFIDTDNREILKFTHYSGSFKEFTNFANIELATLNDQKMVIGDQFLTVRKGQNVYVAEHQDLIIGGDQYQTIGVKPDNQDTIVQIMQLLYDTHDMKRLFDIKRINQERYLATVSPLQEQSLREFKTGGDGYAICPKCENKPYEPKEWVITQMFAYHGFGEAGDHSAGSAYDPTTVTQDDIIRDSINAREAVDDKDTRSNFADYVKNKTIGIYLGNICDVCNSTFIKATAGYNSQAGFSPSSQDGKWEIEDPEKENLKAKVIENAKKLFAFEKLLGDGGDKIIDIRGSKVETIGPTFNDLISFRTDPIGKLRIDGMKVAIEGVYDALSPSPHIEYVDVDNIPGGDYNLTVGNKYKLIVGSNGINIKTTGPLDISGAITNIIGEQLNISSTNEVYIDGGERLYLRARRMVLFPFEHNPVIIEGQLHVSRNVIIGGGTYMEGEVGLLHATAPRQWYNTLPAGAFFELPAHGWADHKGSRHLSEHHVTIPEHFHMYENLPLNLTSCREEVRDIMVQKGINSIQSVAAADSVGGVGAGYDEGVFNTVIKPAANGAALGLDPTAGLTTSSPITTTMVVGTSVIYTVYYNYMRGDAHVPRGLQVDVTYNTESELITGEPVARKAY